MLEQPTLAIPTAKQEEIHVPQGEYPLKLGKLAVLVVLAVSDTFTDELWDCEVLVVVEADVELDESVGNVDGGINVCPHTSTDAGRKASKDIGTRCMVVQVEVRVAFEMKASEAVGQQGQA
ncbi:unnamed protein product [Cyclocybe aegerita]|uniref:Uncharacterized protein n=1 Tax=Cyclocybe aegerita TaxID=1973307 RepID=A0A8S0VX87_CYCAE|nr:unnamed protein product [Cyclocybe aegerita]